MSLINLDAPMMNGDGTPATTPKPGSETREPVLLGHICCTALLTDFPDDRIDGKEKHRRFKLWQALKNAGQQDIEAADVELLKRLIGMGWSPLLVGQAWELLEGRSVTFISARDAQAAFDAAQDARNMPSGATKQPDQFAGD